MLNLINNAIKYTHAGGISAYVSYDRSTGFLRFCVKDTGIGIREEDIGKLFCSFQRLEEDKNRNIEGTGLGLNITMRLVRMMDGDISVNSVYGKGTEFIAEMKQPVIDETPVGDFAQNISRLQDQTSVYKPSLTAPSARVLIVDDNDMNLEVIGALLEDTRIHVTMADSGKECLNILKENTFDLILLDQMMPGMSGVQTLAVMKREHLADGVPVIALTADAIVGARDNYIREGFSDYLSKPVMYEALEAILIKYLKPELVRMGVGSSQETKTPEEEGEKPLVIAISDSPQKLRRLKALLGDEGKGVFVKDAQSASRYLEKNFPQDS
jgi:CheY-like chemotaxis protein